MCEVLDRRIKKAAEDEENAWTEGAPVVPAPQPPPDPGPSNQPEQPALIEDWLEQILDDDQIFASASAEVQPEPVEAYSSTESEWSRLPYDVIRDWIDLDDLGGHPPWPPGLNYLEAVRELRSRDASGVRQPVAAPDQQVAGPIADGEFPDCPVSHHTDSLRSLLQARRPMNVGLVLPSSRHMYYLYPW